jgi:hypothetical protein
MNIFYWLRFEIPPTWRARSPYLYPPGTWWPGYTPGTGFPFAASYYSQGYGGGIRNLLHAADILYIQVNRDVCVFDHCEFRLIRSETFILFLYMRRLKFRIVRPIVKQQIFNNAKTSRPRTVAHKLFLQIMLLLRHYASMSSVSLRPPSKADLSKQCLPITVRILCWLMIDIL